MKDLTIEVTNHCSLNCVHCSSSANSEGNIFMSTEYLRKILEEFGDFEHVRLSGGEPFEHINIERLCEQVKSANRELELLSSGVCYKSHIPKSLLRLCKKNIDNVVFSLYGRKEIHDNVCRADAYDHLTKSVALASDEGVPFSFHTIALRQNAAEIEDVFQYIAAVNPLGEKPKLRIMRLIKQGRAEENENLALSKRELQGFVEHTKQLSEKYGIPTTYSGSLLEEGCTCGSDKAVVTVYGERIGCSALKFGTRSGHFACRQRW